MTRSVKSVLLLTGAGFTAALASLLLIAGSLTPEPTLPKYVHPTSSTPFMIEALPKPQGQKPLPAATGRLVISSARLNAKLLTMRVPSDGVLHPPDFGDVFLVTGYGAPRVLDSGTVFVAMHASPARADHAVGSLLQNAAGIPTLKSGARITLDGMNYTVTGSRIVRKGALTDQADMWNGSHDLVLITCSEVIASGRSHALSNALIFANRE